MNGNLLVTLSVDVTGALSDEARAARNADRYEGKIWPTTVVLAVRVVAAAEMNEAKEARLRTAMIRQVRKRYPELVAHLGRSLTAAGACSVEVYDLDRITKHGFIEAACGWYL